MVYPIIQTVTGLLGILGRNFQPESALHAVITRNVEVFPPNSKYPIPLILVDNVELSIDP